MAFSSDIPIFRSECPPKIWMEGGLRQVILELTGHCNNRCPGCLNESFIEDFHSRTLKAGYHHQPLSKDDWLNILLKLPKTVKNIILSGGEPTLHKDILPIIKELDNKGYRFTIFTNGRWLDPDSLIRLLKKTRNFNGFLISLHGTTASTHESFSGKTGSFNETLDNIRRASKAKLPITVSTVITQQNLHELTHIPALAIKLGAEAISFNRYLYTPDRVAVLGEEIYPPTSYQLKTAIQTIESLRIQYENKLDIGYGPTIPYCFEESSSQGCSAGDASLVIDPWGNVKPCLHVDLLCGNIIQQDFDDIWNSKNLKLWRGLSSESCTSCSSFSVCGGGCRAMSLSWGNNQDPLMEYRAQRNFIKLSDLVE